ncbi:copper transporter 1A isoform X2 [Osmia lignaria lignaria]|uniref:copper transporter 1A isoform X2 n=1 Tax=Osmia lignaria lignaria TaxID=1437193 RepID=UPI00402BD5DF
MSHDHMAHLMNSSGGQMSGDTHAFHGDMDHSNMHENMHASMQHNHMNHESMDHTGHAVEACADMGMHGMSMTFHGGYCEHVLFESWRISSIGGLVGSMIGIMIMAALYEGLKYYREYLFWKTYNALQYRSVTMPPEKNVVAEDNRVVHMVGEVIHKQPTVGQIFPS